jgi:hypothetical protein
MSRNRENVTWQSSNGKWNLAFYDWYEVNQDDDDFDPEWDVEYTDDFNWASTGHATREAAESSWKGANPGGGTHIEYSPETAKQCDGLDAKAAAYRIAQDKATTEHAALLAHQVSAFRRY